MRVTFRSVDAGVQAINTAAEQMLRAQGQVQTGRRVRVASDDPAAAQRVIAGRTEMGAIDSFTRSADTASARLSVMDGVLTALVDTLTEAQTTAAQGRGSTADQPQRDAVAAALLGQRDRVASFLNTTFRGTYLFSGGQAQTPPYVLTGAGWTYQGDLTPVTVEIGRARDVAIALNGNAIAQGSDAVNVLTAFDNLIVAVQARDEAGMAAGMDGLSRAFERTLRTQSQVGSDLRSAADEQVTLTQFRLATLTRVSKDEDADMVAAITEMNQAQTAYQAALGAVGASAKVSLLDYLR